MTYGAIANISHLAEFNPPAFLQNARRGDKFGFMTYVSAYGGFRKSYPHLRK